MLHQWCEYFLYVANRDFNHLVKYRLTPSHGEAARSKPTWETALAQVEVNDRRKTMPLDIIDSWPSPIVEYAIGNLMNLQMFNWFTCGISLMSLGFDSCIRCNDLSMTIMPDDVWKSHFRIITTIWQATWCTLVQLCCSLHTKIVSQNLGDKQACSITVPQVRLPRRCSSDDDSSEFPHKHRTSK